MQTWFPSANVDAAYILGVCYIQTKNYPNARGAFAKMFQGLRPIPPPLIFSPRACCCVRISARSPKNTAKKPSHSIPSFPSLIICSANSTSINPKFPKPSRNLKRNSPLNPGDPAAYYKLADAYSRIQKFDEAEKLLQRSIWLDATSTGPYILLGKVLQKKGETELAIRALQRAIAMDPNNSYPASLLGRPIATSAVPKTPSAN